MSIDVFFKRKYNRDTYNCAHFACEVWEHLTGQAVAGLLAGLLLPFKDRHASVTLRHSFERLDGPRSPCFVLMQRPRHPSHVGIYFNGRVLHIKPEGVEYQPIEVVSIGFKTLGYYKC